MFNIEGLAGEKQRNWCNQDEWARQGQQQQPQQPPRPARKVVQIAALPSASRAGWAQRRAAADAAAGDSASAAAAAEAARFACRHGTLSMSQSLMSQPSAHLACKAACNEKTAAIASMGSLSSMEIRKFNHSHRVVYTEKILGLELTVACAAA